jgi:Domain of unknown function (DUF6970)
MKTRHLVALIALIILLAGCSKSTQTENPDWVDQLIKKFESEPVGNPPQSIWRYEYQGQVVYYVPEQCCDMFSTLYDANHNVICAPNGGIAGTGDGRCKDFLSQRTGEQLIWQDQRTR